MASKKGIGTGLALIAAFFGFMVLIALFAIMQYNNIQNLNLQTDNAWAKVQTVYQERFDLIPRIISSVTAQTQAEKDLLTHIADARARFMNGQSSPDDKVAAANDLDRSIRSFYPIVLQENYPNVQFAQAFKDFRTIYEGQENRIRVERNRYNDAVTDYNTAIKTFPGSVFASMFGFKERKLFEAAAGAENAPDVNFNIK